MHAVFTLLGILVIAVLFTDVLRVTMGKGSGLFMKRLTGWAWQVFLRIQHSRVQAHLLSAAGTVIVGMNIVVWVVLLWTGWMLIFSGAEQAVVHGQTQTAAGFWERVYFTGYTIFTLGVGDYVPTRPLWQVMTAVASASGLFVVTLSISYLIPVLQANTQKRQLAVQIASLGQRPDEIILNTYDGTSCQPLGEHLNALTTELAKLEQRHLTYPLLHYFHSQDRTEAVALSVAALDEALTIIEYGLAESTHGLEPALFHPARKMISRYLGTLKQVFIESAAEVPPLPSLEALRERGIPVVDEETFRERSEAIEDRRRLLLALVENDGWSWFLIQPSMRDRAQDRVAF